MWKRPTPTSTEPSVSPRSWGSPHCDGMVGHFRTARTILAGDLEEGERRVHAGFELGQATGQRDAPSVLAVQLFVVRFEQGRLGELEERLAERVAAAPRPPGCFGPAWRCCSASSTGPTRPSNTTNSLAVENFTAVPLDPAWIVGHAGVRRRVRLHG